MLLRNAHDGDGAVSVMTMLSLVALRVVSVTASSAISRCGVVTLTAPLCSSVYTLRILIVLILINATPKYVHWRWGCRCDDYAVACGAAGCLWQPAVPPVDTGSSHWQHTDICMPSDRGQGRHVHVIYILLLRNNVQWGRSCRSDDYIVACGTAGCPCDSLWCHR